MVSVEHAYSRVLREWNGTLAALPGQIVIWRYRNRDEDRDSSNMPLWQGVRNKKAEAGLLLRCLPVSAYRDSRVEISLQQWEEYQYLRSLAQSAGLIGFA